MLICEEITLGANTHASTIICDFIKYALIPSSDLLYQFYLRRDLYHPGIIYSKLDSLLNKNINAPF